MNHKPSLAQPAFPDDDGQAYPELVAALGDEGAVAAVLPDVRVFVPVIALLEDVPVDGDKEADMAAVLMTGADGRQALLTFSSVDAMKAWNTDARPVPVWGRDAARAALEEGASALLVDLGSPGFTVVEISAG